MADTDLDLGGLLMKLLEQETSDEAMKIRYQIMRRIALESDIKPARIPVPQNITEIGGYYNLLMNLGEMNKSSTTMVRQMLASALGLPMPVDGME